jgi:cell wall-associated NlpC family hydrolase
MVRIVNAAIVWFRGVLLMNGILPRVNAVVAAIILAFGLMVCAAGSPARASAATPSAAGLGNLSSASTPGMCVDADSNHYPGNGDNVQLWSCNAHPEQLWTLTSSGQLRNAGTGLCADADSNHYPSNGDNVQLWSCNTNPEQRWVFTTAGQLRNASSSLCLDADSNHYPSNGDNLQLWSCNTNPEQRWVFTIGHAGNTASGLCLDADSNHYPSNGDNVQLWSCNTNPEQLWTLTSSGQLRNTSTGLCADADSNHYPGNGDNVQLWSCNTHPEQIWVSTTAGQLRNASSGLCLDADSNHYPSNGDNVQLWSCNTNPEQVWTLGGTAGDDIAAFAASMNGQPYCWSGGNTSGPTHGQGNGGNEASDCGAASTKGFDCGGLAIYAVYQATHITIARHTIQNFGTRITSESQLRPGDVILFGGTWTTYDHVGIYAGNGYMWNANTAPKQAVQEVLVSWETHDPSENFIGAVRF